MPQRHGEHSRRYGTYFDSWEEFIESVRNYAPSQRRAMLEEATTSGRLSVIIGAQREWLLQSNARRYRDKLLTEQRRITQERRMTADPTKYRQFVDDDTRAMMPPLTLHVQTPLNRSRSIASSAAYWRGLAHASGRRIERILGDRDALSLELQRLRHPYGGSVSADELAALRATMRAIGLTLLAPEFRRRPPKPRTHNRGPLGFRPVGMTAERALQIAAQHLADKETRR